MRLTDASNRQHVSRTKAAPAPAVRGIVVSYARSAGEDSRNHENITRTLIAERLATLRGYGYAGEYRDLGNHPGPVYFVPCETLALETAHALGIRNEHDLFGGVVPFPFVA